MSDDREVAFNLELSSYPASGNESYREVTVFGPDSPNLAVLFEIRSEDSTLSLVIGNGPERADVPKVMAKLFRDVADAIEDLESNPTFLDAIYDFD